MLFFFLLGKIFSYYVGWPLQLQPCTAPHCQPPPPFGAVPAGRRESSAASLSACDYDAMPSCLKNGRGSMCSHGQRSLGEIWVGCTCHVRVWSCQHSSPARGEIWNRNRKRPNSPWAANFNGIVSHETHTPDPGEVSVGFNWAGPIFI